MCGERPIFEAVRYRLLLLFYSLSLLLICFWQQRFGLPWFIVPLHLLVAAVLHSAAVALMMVFYRLPLLRLVAILLAGLWLFLTLLFYLLIFGSVAFWGDIVTLRILSTYLKDFSRFLQSLPFSYRELWALVLLFAISPFALALLLQKKIGHALDDLWSGRSLFLYAFILLLFAAPFGIKIKRFIHLRGEPLMVMLFDHMWGVKDNPLFSRRRVRVGFEDQQLRHAYRAEASRKLNVVLIVVDALRADHLSAYGYRRKTSPFIDALLSSGKAVKVQKCYSTCACTLCGVSSILLSRSWNECAVNGFNIVSLLRDKGYHAYAFISGAHREWYNMARFYANDCDLYFDGKDSKKYYFKDDRVLLEGLEKVGPAADSPAFFYFHLQSSHETGLLLDKYALYKPCKKSLTTRGMNDEAAVNEYDNKVLQADDMIRQLFGALVKKGYLKNSLVVITADHGQGLGEHGVSGHVDWLYDPQVSVPLIFCDDSAALYRNLSFARMIDIAPTIADRLGLQAPASWMGLSLLHDSLALYSYHETGRNGLETDLAKYMIVYSPATDSVKTAPQKIFKYIFTDNFRNEELYEVLSDPSEQNNLVNTQPQLLLLLRGKAHKEIQKSFGND